MKIPKDYVKTDLIVWVDCEIDWSRVFVRPSDGKLFISTTKGFDYLGNHYIDRMCDIVTVHDLYGGRNQR